MASGCKPSEETIMMFVRELAKRYGESYTSKLPADLQEKLSQPH